MTYRDELDRPLTSVEVDANFRELNSKLDALTNTLNGGAGINVPPETKYKTELEAINNTLTTISNSMNELTNDMSDVKLALIRKGLSIKTFKIHINDAVNLKGDNAVESITDMYGASRMGHNFALESSEFTLTGEVKWTNKSNVVKTYAIAMDSSAFRSSMNMFWQNPEPEASRAGLYEANLVFKDKYGLVGTASASFTKE